MTVVPLRDGGMVASPEHARLTSLGGTEQALGVRQHVIARIGEASRADPSTCASRLGEGYSSPS